MRRFTIDEFVARLQAGERYVLIDVREDHEWVEGHIPSAHHIGRGVLEREIGHALPEQDTPIVLYCCCGCRSGQAADRLLELGYANVVSLEGGWRDWNERGLPTMKPEATTTY